MTSCKLCSSLSIFCGGPQWLYVVNMALRKLEHEVGGSEVKFLTADKVGVVYKNGRKKQKLCHTASVLEHVHQSHAAETNEAVNLKVGVNIESKENYNKSNDQKSKKIAVVELSSDDSGA
ncbi:uncharacterized protein [Primulina huaijiensis]|uniref:uncharacterized protein isoform X2 n=1 Tax=Primulina huaijiensis TaxID=1492673 RepID=UPI003CC781C4